MGLFKQSVKSLVGRGDVRGLINKLDQKDIGEACIGLQVLRERSVPALIELLGTPKEAIACVVLANIGALALPALAEVIRSGPDNCLAAASETIIHIRQNGVKLPDNVIATLQAVKTGGPGVDIGRRAMAASALGELVGLQAIEKLVRADLTTSEASSSHPAPSVSTPHSLPDLLGEAHILEGHTDTVEDCAFSSEGRFIVSASDDRTLRVWDAATGHLLHILQGHTMPVYMCAFSPDGRFIVSASVDHTSRVWDANTGQPLPESVISGTTAPPQTPKGPGVRRLDSD